MKKPRTHINGVVIRTDGLVTTFSAPSWRSFAEQVVEIADSPWARRESGHGSKPTRVAKVFGAEGEHLEEHHLAKLREALRDGTIGN